MEAIVFRNSFRYLLGTWLTRLPPVVLVAGAADRYAAALPWWWFEILAAMFVLVLVAVLAEPVWAAKFRTLTVDDDVLTLRWGWFAPETRVTTRAQVTSVQVEEPLPQRLSRVRAVTILTSGVTGSTITMPALRPEDAMALERLLVLEGPPGATVASLGDDESLVSAPVGPGTASPAEAGQAPEGVTVLYRASVRDLVATSVSGGYVVVIAAAVIGTAQDIGSLVNRTFDVSWTDPRTCLLAIGALSLALMALIAARFRGFRIEQTASGQVRIVYGLLERTEHTISAGQVLAVSLVRTPVDLILGTTRLVFSTAWLSDGSRTRLVFPSMPRATAARVVADAVGQQLPELFVERRRWWVSGLVLIVAAAAAVVLGAPKIGFWAAAAVAVGGLGFGLIVVRYGLSTLSVTPSDDVVGRTVSLNHTVTVYFSGTVNSVVERRVPGIPIRNVTVLGWAHRRFVHRVPVRSAAVASRVSQALRASVARLDAPIGPNRFAHGGDQ